jgi:hypothetical protein
MSNSCPTSTGGSESVIENQGFLGGSQMVVQAVEEPITAEFSSLVSKLSDYIQDIPPVFPKFMQLPIELREKIYVQCFLAQRLRELTDKQNPRRNHPTPNECWDFLRFTMNPVDISNSDRSLGLDKLMANIAPASYEVRSEVFRVLLRYGGKVSIREETGVNSTAQVFDSLDAHWPLESLHTIRYYPDHALSNRSNNAMFEFLGRCPGVHTLVLSFDLKRLCPSSPSSDRWEVTPTHDFLDAHHFRRLLDYKQLQRICLEVDMTDVAPWAYWVDPDFLNMIRAVGKWITKGFEARGRYVRVTLLNRSLRSLWISEAGRAILDKEL